MSLYTDIWSQNRRQKDLIDKYGQENLVQCQVCKKWFRQVGTHVVQIHGYETAREYRKEFGFDVKRGQVPKEYRELKSQRCHENGTINNLKGGQRFWFKKGDKSIGVYERSPQTMRRLKGEIK